jgi:type III secretion protein D
MASTATTHTQGDSLMSKELRVLTGFHAGAQIQLTTTTVSIGAAAAADILISDWSGGMMQLAMDTEGRVTIGAADDAAAAVALDDFAPRRFGDVVLCAGPRAALWPSDLQLLQAMLNAPEQAAGGAAPADTGKPLAPAARPKRPSWLRTGVAAMLIGSVGAGALVLAAGSSSQAAEHPPSPVTIADLQRALDRLHDTNIALHAQPNGFVATGIVPNAAGVRAAHASLQLIAGNRLRWQVKPADDIARELAESLHEPHIKVRYAGGGRFEVAGNTGQLNAVREVVERFRNDMAPLALSIAVNVTRTDELGVSGSIDSALTADNVRYVESSDGSKNFVAELSSNTTVHEGERHVRSDKRKDDRCAGRAAQGRQPGQPPPGGARGSRRARQRGRHHRLALDRCGQQRGASGSRRGRRISCGGAVVPPRDPVVPCAACVPRGWPCAACEQPCAACSAGTGFTATSRLGLAIIIHPPS